MEKEEATKLLQTDGEFMLLLGTTDYLLVKSFWGVKSIKVEFKCGKVYIGQNCFPNINALLIYHVATLLHSSVENIHLTKHLINENRVECIEDKYIIMERIYKKLSGETKIYDDSKCLNRMVEHKPQVQVKVQQFLRFGTKEPYDATSKLVLSYRNHTTYLSDKAIITESGPFRISIKNIAEDGMILKGRFQVRRVVYHFHTDKIDIIRRKYEVCEVKMNIEIPPNGSLFLIPSNHTLDSSEEIITFSKVRCFGREKGFKITTVLIEIDERSDNLSIPLPIGTYATLEEFYIVDQ